LGISEDGEIDLESVPAKILIRLDAIIREQTKGGLSEEERSRMDYIERMQNHVEDWKDRLDEEDQELEEEFARRVAQRKSGGMNAVFGALRADQGKESVHVGMGVAGGALLSTVMRAMGAMTFRGQTLGEFFQSHFSLRSDEQALYSGLEHMARGGESIWESARLQLGDWKLPGGISPEDAVEERLPLSAAWVQRYGLPAPPKGVSIFYYSQEWIDEWMENHGGKDANVDNKFIPIKVEGGDPEVPVIRTATDEFPATYGNDPNYYSPKPPVPPVEPAEVEPEAESEAESLAPAVEASPSVPAGEASPSVPAGEASPSVPAG
ncbi:MAG: hypothetical protein AAB855_01550, partial [Patescibacteria group bacterium]